MFYIVFVCCSFLCIQCGRSSLVVSPTKESATPPTKTILLCVISLLSPPCQVHMAHGKQLHPETGKVAANESRFVQPSYLIFLWCSSRPFPFVRLFLLAQSFNKGEWYERLVARKNSNRFEPLQWSDLACLLISGRAIIPSGLQLPRVSCAPCFVVTSLTLDSTTKHDPSWREKSKQ